MIQFRSGGNPIFQAGARTHTPEALSNLSGKESAGENKRRRRTREKGSGGGTMRRQNFKSCTDRKNNNVGLMM
jgi:hypothetical protein